MTDKKVLRVIFPEWQGGANPNYAFGGRILDFIAPKGKGSKTVQVPVSEDYETELELKDGIVGGDAIIEQQKAARQILEQEKPDKIITFGGDCSISQAPFDYLHGLYPENTAILWVDTHPDISTPNDFNHEHAMVLGNLLGDGVKEVAALVQNPFKYDQILYVGLNAEEMLGYEKEYIQKHNISYLDYHKTKKESGAVTQWLKDKGIKQVLIHLDVDVFDTKDFLSQLSLEPGLGPVDYALGKMNVEEIFDIICEVEKVTDVVGFSIAEYMPWDLIRLNRCMKKMKLFKE